jgi:AmmeMemoRadiSam system protein A
MEAREIFPPSNYKSEGGKMRMQIGDAEGKELLKAAREAIEYYFEYKETPSVLKGVDLDKYQEPRGVFVTLKRNGQLRGCIGFPLPVFPLGIAVAKSAVAAAFEDYRFPSLSREEMDELEIELSILSVPVKLNVSSPEEYLKKIKVGCDGLIIRHLGQTGLLLPQVPLEQGWGVEEYLEGLCGKAGLHEECWKEEGAEIKAFSARIFREGK